MRQLDNPHDIATGKWHSILSGLGIDIGFLKKKHGPCPVCGGKDRFRFDNKDGKGTFYCNQCGAGDGFKLLEIYHGWTFKEALARVKEVAGVYEPAVEKRDTVKTLSGVKAIWNEALLVEEGDPVWLYLTRRTGITSIPKTIRYHPALSYIDDEGAIEHHPALVAVIFNAEGKGTAIQRIYLTKDGNKANVQIQKKTLGSLPDGSFLMLGNADKVLGIAEGVETALAASVKFGVSVWAAISADGMTKWLPPEGVEQVVIFGDNDHSFTGQAAAFALAKRLRRDGVSVVVRIPDEAGKDWADE